MSNTATKNQYRWGSRTNEVVNPDATVYGDFYAVYGETGTSLGNTNTKLEESTVAHTLSAAEVGDKYIDKAKNVSEKVDDIPVVAVPIDVVKNVNECIDTAQTAEAAALCGGAGVIAGAGEGTVSTAEEDAEKVVPGYGEAVEHMENAANKNKTTKVIANCTTDPDGCVEAEALKGVEAGAEAMGAEKSGAYRRTKADVETVVDPNAPTQEFDLSDSLGQAAAGGAGKKNTVREQAVETMTDAGFGQRTAERLVDANATAQHGSGEDPAPQCSVAGGRRLSTGSAGECGALPKAANEPKVPLNQEKRQTKRQHHQEVRFATRGPAHGVVRLDRDAPTFADRDYGWERAGGVEQVEGEEPVDVRPPEALGYIVYPVTQAHLYEGYIVSY
mgnify:CR=1 FL=1